MSCYTNAFNEKTVIPKKRKGMFLALGLFTALVVLGCVATLGSTMVFWHGIKSEYIPGRQVGMGKKKVKQTFLAHNCIKIKVKMIKHDFLRHSSFQFFIECRLSTLVETCRCIAKATAVLYHIQCLICSARSLLKKRLAIDKDFFAKCHT